MAADWYMVNESGCKKVYKVKLLKVDKARTRFLSGEEIKELLSACDTVRVLKNGKTEWGRFDNCFKTYGA
jgi:hypothetical protein